MGEILVLGGGVVGLSTSMLLAGDGHTVTLLDRDAAPPPPDPREAWRTWERRGVNQFRLLHFFQPRFRQLLEAELPAAAEAIRAAGALHFDPVATAPRELTGGPREGDEELIALTGRRPVVEAALAGAADGRPGLTIRRGAGVTGLLTAGDDGAGVPHIAGVRTDEGDELLADLVVDATGRRSQLPGWLATVGAAPPIEEREDSGFVYYGRHFRSTDGSVPVPRGGLLSHYGSVSILCLPADNGTWGVGIITTTGDAELRGFRHADRWTSALERFPLVAHWLDGEAIDEVAVMAKIEDRYRRYVVDGAPVATGVVAVGDAWACTNPSIGRGASIGLMHAVALRDVLREVPTERAADLASAWDDATASTVEPWYRSTLHYDRHRLAEAEAATRGEPYEPDDPAWDMTRAMQHGADRDPDLLRGFLRIGGLLATADEVLAGPGIVDKIIAVGAGWRDEPLPGPDRAELVGLAAG
ncbi:FAD-dependent oxidoreductase [soil metagenome]